MIRYQWSTHDLTSGQYSGSYDGIDISRHQGRIHWDELSKVKRLKFIYVKATEGATIKDPWYEANINQARKAEEPNKKEKENEKIIRNRSIGSYLFRIFYIVSLLLYLFHSFLSNN